MNNKLSIFAFDEKLIIDYGPRKEREGYKKRLNLYYANIYGIILYIRVTYTEKKEIRLDLENIDKIILETVTIPVYLITLLNIEGNEITPETIKVIRKAVLSHVNNKYSEFAKRIVFQDILVLKDSLIYSEEKKLKDIAKAINTYTNIVYK